MGAILLQYYGASARLQQARSARLEAASCFSPLHGLQQLERLDKWVVEEKNALEEWKTEREQFSADLRRIYTPVASEDTR
jgi:hypothetical protein